jgi:eukaryotic translation initiation factor 2C
MDSLRRGINEDQRAMLNKVLKNASFTTTHRASGTRRGGFKIKSIRSDPPHIQKFEKDGKSVTVSEYFRSEYGIELRYDFLPCVSNQRDHLFPMEVCALLENQKYPKVKKLTDVQTSDILSLATVPPEERFKKIQKGIATLRYEDNEYCRQFGFNIDPRPVTAEARVLDSPELLYHPSSQEPVVKPGVGMRNMRGKKLAMGGTLDSWAVVVFAGQHEARPDTIERFISDFCGACQNMNLKVLNDRPPILYGDSRGGYEQILKKAFLQGYNSCGQIPPRLLLCVLPRKDKTLYGNIKKITDTVVGVPSQCVVVDHFKRKPANINYLSNVILKVNVKLGGTNCFIRPESIPFLSDEVSMIMGADVSHCGISRDSPSVASLVGTIDPRASRYASSIRYQSARVEEIEQIADMTRELLLHFYNKTGMKPRRLLMFRDGVSDGQFRTVVDHEVKGILEACNLLEAGYQPKVTFVTIQKRHHVRFYPENRRDGDKLGNCVPGTVLDTAITHPTEFDFYLQSHSSLKGTARPGRYHVLFDQNNFSADELQQLTYNLCYLFARSTASVSMATPAYYADILCMRGNFHRSLFGEASTYNDEKADLDFEKVNPKLQASLYFM